MAREKRPNRGSEELGRLFPNHGDKTKISTAVGVGVDVVSRWMSGANKPEPVQRAKLEDLFSIDWRLWDEDIEAPADSDVGLTEHGDSTPADAGDAA